MRDEKRDEIDRKEYKSKKEYEIKKYIFQNKSYGLLYPNPPTHLMKRITFFHKRRESFKKEICVNLYNFSNRNAIKQDCRLIT